MSISTRATATVAIYGPIRPDDLPGLSARICVLLAGLPPGVVVCDVATVPADAVTVDALARLQLAARRSGCHVRLRRASSDLMRLVELMGLEDVLGA